jgi:hypothetical protein
VTARVPFVGGDDELRPLVRELLRELLPSIAAERAEPAEAQRSAVAPVQRRAPDGAEVITLRTDADLDRFVRRLLTLFESPKRRADLRAGRLRFTLGTHAPRGDARPIRRIDKGAVTERLVTDAADAGATLVLGRRAVLTPLARDKARALGVAVERES